MWSDEERTHGSITGALKGGWNVLSGEERFVFASMFFLAILVTLWVGIEVGHHIAPDKPIAEQIDRPTTPESNVTVAHRIDRSKLADWEDRHEPPKTVLPHAGDYCRAHGFEWGKYTSGKGIREDSIAIVCHPEQDDTWTRYYFDLNMNRVDTEVMTYG